MFAESRKLSPKHVSQRHGRRVTLVITNEVLKGFHKFLAASCCCGIDSPLFFVLLDSKGIVNVGNFQRTPRMEVLCCNIRGSKAPMDTMDPRAMFPMVCIYGSWVSFSKPIGVYNGLYIWKSPMCGHFSWKMAQPWDLGLPYFQTNPFAPIWGSTISPLAGPGLGQGCLSPGLVRDRGSPANSFAPQRRNWLLTARRQRWHWWTKKLIP